ncbi:uncharacterized protein [Ptychodera flava]|uniref:uncharacterized protein n=1 Tax=Ptychodera flava TaxID=63121 RepID=UPI00396A45AD
MSTGTKTKQKSKPASKDQNCDYGLSAENPAQPTTDLAVLACVQEQGAFFKEFIEMGRMVGELDIDEQDAGTSMTALHWAVAAGNLESVKILLECGAKVNITDRCGFTPLFYATGRAPNVEISKCLIEHKANVMHATKDGVTALHGAALQGNVDCMKLLMKHGANPRATNDEGTTPLDLCQDEETRKLLHKANRKADEAKERKDASCAWCGSEHSNLKKCARCHSVMYCRKECQVLHWKEGGHKEDCRGYVLAYPIDSGFCTTMSAVFGSLQPRVSMHLVDKTDDAKKRSRFLMNKRFVVKVQIPMRGSSGAPDGSPVSFGAMMVYNEDKTVMVFINESEPGYSDIRKKINREGFLGIKGFFWAELSGDEKAAVKIYHGKMAPFQQW